MLDLNPRGMRRILSLRQFSLFSAATLGDLALLAENVSEASYRTGELVAPPGKLDSVHLVVEGAIESGAKTARAREAFGLLELLADRPLVVPARATSATRTLQLFASDLGDVLEEGFGVLRGVLHELAARVAWRPGAAPRQIEIPDGAPLGLVERLLVLRQLAPFASARLEPLGALAHSAEETTFAPGALVARAGERAAAVHVVLEGRVRATTGDPLTAGSTIGGVEALGELPHARTFEAASRVRTLAFPSQAIFDVIEDHTELGLAVLATFASTLVH